MAINSNSVLGENPCRSLCSSKTSNMGSSRLIKINFAGKDSCSSSRAHGPINKDISPYFTNDKVQLLSRVIAKKAIKNKPTEFISSFPSAASIYKANSDEFKLKKRSSKKVKKSVLTLPNEPVPMPKTYTVSDLNDSEYFNAVTESRANKPKKRRTTKRKKTFVKEHPMRFRDRDARYCSQLNIDLDCSSSEVINFTGDGERISKLSYKSNNSVKAGSCPHDVWEVLKNLNEFQFRPSPTVSQHSVVPLRKRRPLVRRSNNSNDTRFIETCRTEEFSYISSFEVDNKTNESCSPSSSFDRVTVIDKQIDQDEMLQQLNRNIFGTNLNFRDKIQSNQIRGRNKPRLKNNSKKILRVKKKVENNPALTNNTVIAALQLGQKNLAVEHCNNQFLPQLEKNSKIPIKPIENCGSSEKSSIKENDSGFNDNLNKFQKGDRLDECNDMKYLTKNLNHKVNMMKCTDDPEKQMHGMSKVIVNKATEIDSLKLVAHQRKPRLALTLPNTNIPKLSRFEIKKRLASQKFPIVVLGKDQLTNRGIYVANIDSPQFDGLDKHIWPFMLKWSDEKRSGNIQVRGTLTQKKDKETIKSKNLKVKHKLNQRDDVTTDTNRLPNTVLKKTDECKRKKSCNLPATNNKLQLTKEVASQVVQEPKAFNLLKNKMFQFLLKKPTPKKVSEKESSNRTEIEKKENLFSSRETSKTNRQIEITKIDKLVGTSETAKTNRKFEMVKTNKLININETTKNNRQVEVVKTDKKVNPSGTIINDNMNKIGYLNNVTHREVTDKLVENKIVIKPYSSVRHPWAKGKWASDFIENIIKKIRSGVYYGVVDRKENKYRLNGALTVSTQTDTNASKNVCCQMESDMYLTSDPILKKEDLLKNIPGFDETLTTLEIETISTKQIAVKHCITNVVVQFDIEVLSEARNVTHTNQSMSCIPLHVNDNQEKVFKCNTSIINAFLPAELCSIIPTMMQTLLDTENICFLPSVTVENKEPRLTAVSELIEIECPPLIMNAAFPGCSISNEIRPILNGRFTNTFSNYKNVRKTDLLLPTDRIDYSIVPLLPRFDMQIFCNFSQPSTNPNVSIKSSYTLTEKPCQSTNKIENTCMALQLYEPKNFSVVPFSGVVSTDNFMKQTFDRLNLNGLNKIITCNDVICYINNITIHRSLVIPRSKSDIDVFLPSSDTVGIISLYNSFKKYNQIYSERDMQSLYPIETNIEIKEKIGTPAESKTGQRKKGQPIKVLRKKSYAKFYRKCNSMSSISNYKCTPLNRITNLEEFCQVLGSNLFCNVLDGCPEKKILAAIEEMKNWITELSSKQALLILLLTNKKDTPNLIRFRPVILQGIAVNRITKADELDTEIEVIERENFHKSLQHEGISYLPVSTKNQDNLLEELYWIAKTTASDYQKTFDESSEKLLKSLLEKRKKLNPSYLRVMARYVGLGLLSPTKL